MNNLSVHSIGSVQDVKELDKLQEPPMWMRYCVYWFRIGLSIFLLISVLIGIGGCSLNAAPVPWEKANNVVPSAVLEQVIQENTELNAKEAINNILSWSIERGKDKFTVFDFNTPKLCGKLGCLYAGYLFKKDKPMTQAFLSYLNPNLPPRKTLLQIGESRDKALPCVKILQTEQEKLRQLNFCFNGNRYQVADSQIFATSKN